jgi:hypothetical protein
MRVAQGAACYFRPAHAGFDDDDDEVIDGPEPIDPAE